MRLRSALALLLLPVLSACPSTSGRGDDDDASSGVLPAVEPGSLVITEILARPNSGRPEYIELINTSAETIDLFGCQVFDGGTTPNEWLVSSPVEVEPGAYALLGTLPFLGLDEGELPTDGFWDDDITLNQSDETESVGLNCPDGTGARQLIDEVAFDWSGFGLRQGRSWQLVAEPDAAANDDPANWCEAPAQDNTTYAVVEDEPDYGTPGAPTICEQLFGETPDTPGQLVITEILVADFTGTREWFELHNPGPDPLDLRGCILNDAAVGAGDPTTHTLDAEVGQTGLDAGGYLLLSKSDVQITPGDDDNDPVTADYPYGSLGFNNSGDQLLWIECPVEDAFVTIDEVAYNWEGFSDFRGRSLALDPGSNTAVGNDDPGNWCLAGDDQLFYTLADAKSGDSETAHGTPGRANAPCPVPDPAPAEGDLVFSEILVRADSGLGSNEEWFELKNTSGVRLGLDGCLFRNINADGVDIDEEPVESPFGVSVDPDEYAVFVRSSASDTIDCALPYLATYGSSISFNNSDVETLQLVCPDGAGGELVVDSITTDAAYEAGIPWQLRTGAESDSANDDPSNWCIGTAADTWTWSCPADTPVHFGTPGAASNCD